MKPTNTSHRGRVLVADDEIFIRTLIKRTLNEEGYRVSSAADGMQAVQTAQLERPDVVVIDLDMPRCNGLAAIEAIHQLKPAPEIIVVSGDVSADKQVELDALGARCILHKPFSLDALSAVVDAAAERARTRPQPQAARRTRRPKALRTRVAAAGFVLAVLLFGIEGSFRATEWISSAATVPTSH